MSCQTSSESRLDARPPDVVIDEGRLSCQTGASIGSGYGNWYNFIGQKE
jgi:hypothetical protein